MPWITPALKTVRSLVRDAVNTWLPGADANIGNSVLRVMSDVQAAVCFLVLEYLDWLALQLLPDTAEKEWLDRHGKIWLVNADGSTGRKVATSSAGQATFTGTVNGAVVPAGSLLQASSQSADASGNTVVTFQTQQDVTTWIDPPANGNIIALSPGSFSNLPGGTALTFVTVVSGVNASATVTDDLTGGTDTETDDELRARVLQRIRQPPMGGDANDYVQWALAVPGVTRAWCFPQEMGIGTCTLRFMMDDLRASNGGFPLPGDEIPVAAYINEMRPVTVQDMFVAGPIPYPINVRITYLDADTRSTHDAITESLLTEFLQRQMPGQTWYRAWTDEGIMAAAGVNAYDLQSTDVVMPSAGYMPVLGDITYG